MTLPLSRPRTYAPGTDLRSADINLLFDAVIGGWHGEIWVPLPIESAGVENGSATYDGNFWTLDATGSIQVPIPLLHYGSRLKKIRVLYKSSNAGTTMKASLLRRAVDAAHLTGHDSLTPNGLKCHDVPGDTNDHDITFDSGSTLFDGSLPFDTVDEVGHLLRLEGWIHLYSVSCLVSRGES